MASTFVATGTYSNLTRLQLEQLRKADFFAGSKALTVGDSALPPEGVVGPGDINAEPFLTGPNVLLDDVYTLTPPAQPGPGITTQDQPGSFTSETAKWYGPTYVTDGTQGWALSATVWNDVSGVNFVLAGVQAGDILLIKPSNTGEANANGVATVQTVTATQLTCIHINSPNGGGTSFSPDPTHFLSAGYVIMRPNALQLFAVPASGATGFEQTFLAVRPGSSLHNNVAPTTDQINADRIKNLVPSQYALNTTVDRADAVFDSPGPRTSLDLLGYRLVLYTDNGLGTGPNLSNPVATLNPVIDPGIVATDQRFTIDPKAGIVRFSCAPKIGGQIKVAGGTNPTTGRLNLYAVFWAVDQTLTVGAARSLYAQRSTTEQAFTPARMYFNSNILSLYEAWTIGATNGVNAFSVIAPNLNEESPLATYFGTFESSAVNQSFRGFVYRQGANFTGGQGHINLQLTDIPAAFANIDAAAPYEAKVGHQLEFTVSDISGPPAGGGDFIPTLTVASSSFGHGTRETTPAIQAALLAAATSDYSTVRLKRGRYFAGGAFGVIYVPPGVVIEGDGPGTVIQVRNTTSATNTTITPGFKFGPNTPWGVYDLTWNGSTVTPTIFDYTASNIAQRLEGVSVIWNPVRRVWAIAWADLNLDAVWFNEIRRDGTTTFPGFGINVKTTANPLFSTLSANSTNHTGGHYPRLCHQAPNDTYAVVWVDQVTVSAVVGPLVYLNAFQVTPAIAVIAPGNPAGGTNTGTAATLAFVNTSAFPITDSSLPTNFSDHPSIAADNSSVSPFWTAWVGVWAYNVVGGQIQNSTAYKTAIQISTVPTIPFARGDGNSNNWVISSTDVDEDQAGNALFVWCIRAHSLITGSQGSINLTSQLSDASITNFTNLGVEVGSKFMYLGSSTPLSSTYDSTYGYAHTGNLGVVTPYGTDGTIVAVGTTHVTLKANFTGGNYSPGVPYTRLSSAYTSISGALLNDTTTNFIAAGIQAGDQVSLTRSGETHTVVNVNSATQLQLDSTITGAVPHNYEIFYGQAFNWSIVPNSYIQGVIFTSVNFFAQNIFNIAGYPGANNPNNYVVEPIEPDYVRVRHGGDNWLVVYQSMQTTSYLSHDSQTNWNDNQTTWNGSVFIDNQLIMRETGGAWRRHVSPCVVVVSATGQLLNTTYNQLLGTVSSVPTQNMDQKVARDFEISNRSLGAIVDPLTYRPNHCSTTSPQFRYAHNLALQVSPMCWMQRWTAAGTPGLMPDVTWTGEDWVVVSPTKKAIHSYTGNYFVDGSGNVHLGDPAFYFGAGGNNTTDFNYLRQTIEENIDYVYFPSNATYGLITSVHSEHTVTLGSADSALLNKGNGTTTGQIEWILVRAGTSGVRPGGVKNLGYRVALNGTVIVSSSYNTFADELSDDSMLTQITGASTGVPERLPLMSRSNKDASFYWANLNNDGHNLPGNITDDIPDPESRYMGDVGFRGCSPGAPHGINENVGGEQPFCAIAWGENLYGFAEHVIEGTNHIVTSALNQVRFYRQSFGPYNSGMRNLKIQGFGQPIQPNGATTSGSELKVLSQQLVYTRHGAPQQANGFFATDGFRNFFAVASTRGWWALNNTFGRIAALPYNGGARPCIQGYYTDAVGRSVIRMQGPETQNSPLPGTNVPFEFNSFHGEMDVAFQQQYYSPSAPRVLWDGTRFVCVWSEGGYLGSETSPLICITTFPGSEDTNIQSPELTNPADYQITRKPTQIAAIETRGVSFEFSGLTGSTHHIILDVAFSGKVYACLWICGIDTQNTAIYGQGASTVGVTLFDNVGPGSTLFDIDPVPYSNGDVGSTNGTAFTDTTSGALNFVEVGDVLVIPTTNDDNRGRYLVTGSSGGGHITVYPAFPSIESGVTWTIHRALGASGASSIILGVTQQFNLSSLRDAWNGPCIVWDGKQFVALWRARPQSIINAGDAQENTFQYICFPETGFAHSPSIRRSGTINTSTFQPVGGEFNPGIGLLQNNNFDPQVIYLCNGGQEIVSGTAQSTNNGASTLTDSGANFAQDGVEVGDIVTITSGTNSGQMFTVILGGTTTLTLSQDYEFLSTGTTQNYIIYRKHNVKAMAGDILRVTGVGTTTFTTEFNGDYQILAVDQYNSTMVLSSPLADSTAGMTNVPVYGTVLNSTGYGDQQQTVMAPGNGLSVSEYNFAVLVTADTATLPRTLGNILMNGTQNPTGNAPLALAPSYTFKMVYNEVQDEYAILYSGPVGGGSTGLAVATFDRTTFELKKELLIFQGGGTIQPKNADLAWNGTKYLAVWTPTQGTVQANVPGTVYYALITPNLSIEDPGQVLPVFGNIGIQTLFEVTGNLAGLAPGPTYASYIASSGITIQPAWKIPHVQWNNRLNRWIVSASLYWVNVNGFPATKRDWYGNTYLPTSEMPSEYNLTNTSVASVSGNVLHVTLSSIVDLQYLQPGMKLAWLDPSGVTTAYGGMAMINATGGSYPNITLTMSTSSFGFTGLSAGKLYVLPREDMFVWTLGYDTPSVQVEDADGVFFENVNFSGGTADVSERYKNMGRPIWQSGGPPVGQVATAFVAFQQRPSQYNHVLMTPTKKVDMVRYTNVKSTTKFRNGLGMVPGAPTTDRYYTSGRGRN